MKFSQYFTDVTAALTTPQENKNGVVRHIKKKRLKSCIGQVFPTAGNLSFHSKRKHCAEKQLVLTDWATIFNSSFRCVLKDSLMFKVFDISTNLYL